MSTGTEPLDAADDHADAAVAPPEATEILLSYAGVSSLVTTEGVRPAGAGGQPSP